MTLKLKLGDLMKEKNLTIEKLSEISKVDKGIISRYKRDAVSRLDKSVLERLCESMNISLSDLLQFENDKKQTATA